MLITSDFATNLVGTDDLIRERLRRYRDAGISTLRVGLAGGPLDIDLDRSLGDLARLRELVAEVDAEVPSSG